MESLAPNFLIHSKSTLYTIPKHPRPNQNWRKTTKSEQIVIAERPKTSAAKGRVPAVRLVFKTAKLEGLTACLGIVAACLGMVAVKLGIVAVGLGMVAVELGLAAFDTVVSSFFT